MSNLFIYGTLLEPNYHRNLLILHSDNALQAAFNGKMYLCKSFPFVVPSTEFGDIVQGELYFLKDDKILDVLDAYEGCNIKSDKSFYKRQRVNVIDEHYNSNEAWAYVVNENVVLNYFCQIKHGNWLEYRSGNEFHNSNACKFFDTPYNRVV